MIEAAMALLIAFAILAVVIPILERARVVSRRDQCAANQAELFIAWQEYLIDHKGQFPSLRDVPGNPAWTWGGVVFNADDIAIGLDAERPLNEYMPIRSRHRVKRIAPQIDEIAAAAMLQSAHLFYCPGDCGITDDVVGLGTGTRTAFRAHGTSYRANPAIFDAKRAGLDTVSRAVHRHEIKTRPAEFLLLGDPLWFELSAETGRQADWHGDAKRANLLFLDGSVRFEEVAGVVKER